MPHHCHLPVHLSLHLSVVPVLCWYHDPHVFCVSGSRQKENSPLVQTLLLAGRGERWGADGALNSGLHASVSVHWPVPVGWPSLTWVGEVSWLQSGPCDPPMGRGWWITEDSNTICHKKRSGSLRNWSLPISGLTELSFSLFCKYSQESPIQNYLCVICGCSLRKACFSLHYTGVSGL